MIFNIVTLFPHLLEPFLADGVLGQAVKKGLIDIRLWNPREETSDTHGTVDDRPFGGGDGMVLMIDPLESLVKKIKKEDPDTLVAFMSPQGSPWSDTQARSLYSELQVEGSSPVSLTLICGRYSGIDQRFLNAYVDFEISLGDFVLSGGELAAMAVVDTLSRFHPGVLGHEESAHVESFADGLLEAPCFTRPREHALGNVPEILLSGNHSRILDWRALVSQFVTWAKRPDLLEKKGGFQFSKAQKKILKTILDTDELRLCGLKENQIQQLKEEVCQHR